MSIDFSKQFGRGSAKSTYEMTEFLTYVKTHRIRNPYKDGLLPLKIYSGDDAQEFINGIYFVSNKPRRVINEK